MRVLLVAHGLPPVATGGVELYVDALARALAATGDEVTVLAREGRRDLPELGVRREERGAYAVRLLNNRYRTAWSFAASYAGSALARAAAAIADEVRPDVVHVHHLTGLSTELVAELRRRRIPVLMTAHDYWTICDRGQLLDRDLARCGGPSPQGCARCIGPEGVLSPVAFAAARAAQRAAEAMPAGIAGVLAARARRQLGAREGGGSAHASAARLARMRRMAGGLDLLLVPSETARERLALLGLPEARVRRVDPGVEASLFRRRIRVRGDGPLEVGFLGSLGPSKAPHLLVEAAALLPEETLHVAIHGDVAPYHGDDSYRERLEPLRRRPGVRFAGASPHGEVPGILDGLDALVVPSIWLECAPFVIKEAFAAGLPVVGSDLGAMAEMVAHERTGLLFAPGDAAALAAALGRLAGEPGLLERLSAGAPAVRTIAEDAAEAREIYASLRARPVPRSPSPRPRIAAVVVNYRTPEETLLAARSLAASRRPVDEVVIVDNGSGDGSLPLLRGALPGATLIEAAANLGFAGGVNLGIAAARERGAALVFLVNSDGFVPPDALGMLEAALVSRPSTGIAGPLVVARSDPRRVASAGFRVDAGTGRVLGVSHGASVAGEGSEIRSVDAVAGCAMLLTGELLDALGPLEESYFHTFEEVELCLRARARGFDVLLVPGARFLHAGGRSLAHAPDAIYYATRNHLALYDRNFPRSRTRQAAIVGYNLLHAGVTSGLPRLPALRAFAGGLADYVRGRTGPRS